MLAFGRNTEKKKQKQKQRGVTSNQTEANRHMKVWFCQGSSDLTLDTVTRSKTFR